MATENKALNPVWAAARPFVNGGLSGMMSTVIIQPIDMVKVRIQLGEKGSPFSIAANMIRNQGVGSLYKGLSAGLLRQATYTTARLGIYNNIFEAAKKMNDNKPLPLWQKAVCGLTAGGLGALVGSPADLSLIRMQADTTLPAEQRRNYKGVFDALTRIVKDEGMGGLFTGAGPTVVRACALNMGMLASNDQAKEILEDMGFGGTPVVVGGATIAGFFAAACSLPFDYVKTQMQKMKPDPITGEVPYKSSMDCALKTLRNKGPLEFYTGFPTYCVRIAPHAALTLVFVAWLPKLQAKIGI
ncbi:hypothetical protein CHLNCDRAFT_56352 [Chlorella variabilis]|uniref:Uncharacterized protein n=1 Tax=Chlorella variabilis TaxID=554065 RepID=E1ZQN3_CHLVA|nr:hypothetical protein CHLNCDRAFT_56352 [Chlorella variabilis]EFN51826.1 hypothetical protein CHLNCDRAFT_56352 [Chlorella variabilis]|eukprot:XP_005843928.1 hypothetical protein CHLNCDRAFT_56352 [Chlorella variabilis]